MEGLHLVGFIASVVTEPRRLGFLRELADCIRAQSVPLAGLMVSIHVEPSLCADVGAIFAGIKNTFILLQKRPKKQFVQLAELSARLEKTFPCPPGKHSFILFSDDDDMWHPKRVEFYHKAWQDANYGNAGALDSVTSISAKERFKIDIGCAKHLNSSKVDEMIECGCATLIKASPESSAQQIMQFDCEFHETAVRPCILADFVRVYARLVRTNRFADMQFREFVLRYGKEKEMCACCVIPDHWLYFYRQCDRTYLAATAPIAIDWSVPHPEITPDSEIALKLFTYTIEMTECPCMNAMGISKLTGAIQYLSEGNPEREAAFLKLAIQIRSQRQMLE